MGVVWHVWGRTMAGAGAWCLLFGATPLFFAYDEVWPVLVSYCGALLFLLLLFFVDVWPFTKLGVVRIVAQNMWANAVALLAVAVYPCITLPTLFAGLSLAFAAVLYLIAAITGEKGKTLSQLRAGH